MDSYTNLSELLSMLDYSRRVLAKITDRRSNNQMFIRSDDSAIKEIYNKSSRLFMYIDTLETYLTCSPLYPNLMCVCDIETNYESETISDDLRNYYKAIYNRLFTCLQLLITSIPSDWYDDIRYEADGCLAIAEAMGETGNTEPDLPCVDNLLSFDMSFDFSFDVGEMCGSAPQPPSGNRIIYYGSSSTYLPLEAEILTFAQESKTGFIGTYSFAGGDHKIFVMPDVWGDPIGFTDNGTSTEVAMDLSYTNLIVSGTTFSWEPTVIDGVAYRIYRTLNSLASPITIEIE